jgi:hypothetical protein
MKITTNGNVNGNSKKPRMIELVTLPIVIDTAIHPIKNSQKGYGFVSKRRAVGRAEGSTVGKNS